MTTWRVTAYDPATNSVTIDTFDTEQDARHYAGTLRGRRPTWEIDITTPRAPRH